MRSTLLLLVLLLSFGCKKDEKEEIYRGTIAGKVSDEFGKPLSDVSVTVDATSLNAKTQPDGSFKIEKIPTGKHQLLAAKKDYISEIKEIQVKKDDEVSYDFTLKAGAPALEISATKTEVSFAASTMTFSITSNSAWMISSEAEWIALSKTSGNGNEELTLTIAENTSPEKRSATITITTGTIKKTLLVNQDSPLKILSVSLTTPLTDSVVLLFNKAITVNSLTAKNQTCLATLGYRYLENNSGIKFRYSCGKLGGSYPFEIVVKEGNQTQTIPFNVDFYTKKIQFYQDWPPPSYFVTDDNKYLWFSQWDTKNIKLISVADLKINKEYPVSFNARRLCYNPYNKLIYILSDTPDIYVMDPANGKIIKHIEVNPLPEDNQTYPAIYPETMSFTKSGIGAMSCRTKETNGTEWKVIDSRKDDRIYYHAEKDRIFGYGDVQINYDRTQLYIIGQYNNSLFSFDPVKNVVKDIPLAVHGLFGFMVPNRKNGNIFFVQTYEQYLYNPDNNYLSYVSYLAHGAKGDFSYRPGEEEIMYLFDTADYLQVLDFKHQSTVMYFRTIHDMSLFKPITTTDGKYLLMFANDALYQFNIDLFSAAKGKSTTSAKPVNAFSRVLKSK